VPGKERPPGGNSWGPEDIGGGNRPTSFFTLQRGDDGARDLPWTADPWLRWDTGQAVAVGAAIGILTEILNTDLDPVYWRLRIGHALEALGAAVNP
jgi:hypothetical protein